MVIKLAENDGIILTAVFSLFEYTQLTISLFAEHPEEALKNFLE